MDAPSNLNQLPAEEQNPHMDPAGVLGPVVPVDPEGVAPDEQQAQEGGAHPGQQQGGAHPGQQQQQAQIPTPAEEAATLVTLFDAAIQTTREHQLRPAPLSSLKELIFKHLEHEHAAYLHQKEIFSNMPAPLIEEVVEKGGRHWRLPRLAGLTIHPHTRRVKLSLGCRCTETRIDETWTPQELQQLFTDMAVTCKDSLRTLTIWTIRTAWRPCSRHPAPSVEQLDALLRELHGLEKVHLEDEHSPSEVERLVSSLAASNPGITDLKVHHISSACLRTIWETWPGLEALEGSLSEILERGKQGKVFVTPDELATALQNLKKLKIFKMFNDTKSEALMLVARSHPPGSAPYSLTGFFGSYVLHSTEDAVQLFRVFPNVNHLYVSADSEIPLLCAGLERSPDTRITELGVHRSIGADKLEPLLKLVGQHLKELYFPNDFSQRYMNVNHIDINMIGHYCPQLRKLHASKRSITSGNRFEVTDDFFNKLRFCYLGPTYSEPPAPMVLRLMSSPSLEDFHASVLISEEVAIALTAASGEGRALSSFMRLEINLRGVSSRALAAIVSHAPRMIEFAFRYDEDEVTPEDVRKEAVIRSFLQQTGLRCSVVDADDF